MVGGRECAAVVRAGKAELVTGFGERMCGVTELGGVEYWMSHGADHLTVWKRTGAKLAKRYRSKFHDIGYRELAGAPTARMTASAHLLVVTNRDRIHVFDGKTWSQLALQANVKQLVKRLPAAMK
jgi:hypothetical protein